MPRGDRTGPAGCGPMTGRNLGYCAGYPHPGVMAPAPPMGRQGFGRGGRGYRHMYHATGLPGWARAGYYPAPPTQEEQVEDLKAYAEDLEDELKIIKEQIEQMENDDQA